MKNIGTLLIVAVVVVGCSGGSDAGQAPPPRAPMTQAQIEAMPPEARAAMEAAQKRGEETQRTRGQVGGGQ